MSDYSPKHTPGHDIPFTASAPITGGQLVVISGQNTVAPTAGATQAVAGVARQDAATGARVTTTRGGVQTLVASGAINAGDRVVAAANGRVAALGSGAAANGLGTATTTAADGAKTSVLMDR